VSVSRSYTGIDYALTEHLWLLPEAETGESSYLGMSF
jgi:hypothetical protein